MVERVSAEDYLSGPLAKFRPWIGTNGRSPQRDFVMAALKNRVRIFRGGNQSGKTTIGAYDLACYAQGFHPAAQHQPPIRAWASALDWEFGIGQVLWPALKPWIDMRLVRDIAWQQRGALEIPKKILFRNGSEIEFKSAESGRKKYQGAPIHFLWFDEEHEDEIVEEGGARLLKMRGMLNVTLTPIMRKLWVQKLEARPGTFCARASTLEAARAGVLAGGDVASVEEYFARLPDRQREVRERGDFVSLEGLVYPEFNRATHVLKPRDSQLVGLDKDEPVRPWPLPQGWPRYAAIDFGYGVPTAVPIGALDPDTNTLIVYRVLYAAGIRASRWGDLLHSTTVRGEKSLPPLARSLIADHDAQERAELSGSGISTAPAYKQIEPGLECVQRCLMPRPGLKIRLVIEDQPPIHPVFGRCDAHWLAWELEGYHYPKDKPDKPYGKDLPVKKDDHACDALRYMCVALEPGLEPPGQVIETITERHRRFAGAAPNRPSSAFGG